MRTENRDQPGDLTGRLIAIAKGNLSPGEAEVRSQLRCIVESREFRKSKRSQQFLQHVVDCALRGDAQCLKESIIGFDLFGRAPGYDTGGDSSVRVRASDVRRRLRAYYLRVGTRARVQIELPSGSYIPKFCYLQSIPAALVAGTEIGQQVAARPFPPMKDARLRQLQRVAAGLHAGARCEFTPEPRGAQSETQCTPNLSHVPHRSGPEAAAPEFLYPLLGRLAEAMAGDCVYIGTLTTEDASTVKTVAVVAGGHIAEDFEYALAGSPCENVVGKTVLIYPKAVQREFQNNSVLQEMDVESYAGAPLFDCRGGSLGLLVVLSRRPLLDTQLAKSLLDVYAGRIAAELERKIAEHALYESEQRYQTLFESAGDAILLICGKRFVDCNPKALQLFGCSREQLLGQTLLAFSPPCQPDGSDSREAGLERLDQALRGEAASFDWRGQRLDGSVFDTQFTLTRVDVFGTTHVLAHVRDVTHAREAERRVRESETRFRGVFESAGIGTAVADLQGRLTETNPAVQTMLGYSEAELVGMAFSDYTHPEDFDSDMHLFTELLQGKRERYQIEKRYLRKDGQVVWGMLTTSLVRSPDGEPQYCIRMAENITGRKRAEQALRKSEERFRNLFECSPDGYYLLDLNGVFLDGNRAAELMADCRKEELIGKTLQEAGLLSPDELEKAVRLLSRSTRGEPVNSEEFRLIRRDGGTVDVEIRAFPIEIAGDKVVLGAVRDITQRKRAEQALRESEETFRTIIEAAPDGIYIVGDTGQIIEANEAACRQLGHSREHLLRSQLSDIVAPRFAEKTARRLLERASGTFETAHIRADGTEVPLELSVRRFIFRGQAARLGIARDITGRKHPEKERTSLEQQLQQAQKLESVGWLAGRVAHDFHNLLTVINGYSDVVLKRLQEGDPLRAHVEEIRKIGERAAALTRQMLVASRKQIIEPKPLDLNAVVAEFEKMLRRLLGEDVKLLTELDPLLGLVMADPGQFHQVLMNLAVNARDAMPRGGRLTIKTANAEVDENYVAGHPEIMPGPVVMLAVSDTGAGIEKEIQGRIFDPFFTTKGEGEGTGLGLSTVYGIVRQCGGSISVFSELGQGATFKIFLPRTEATVGSVDASA
jgi:two-component system, cell cycle sensor histidine kinase and response regulator CckA